MYCSLRKQPTFRDATTGFPSKWRLRNAGRNSILMTHHYPDLGSAFDWSIRSTTQIWAVTRQYEFLRSFLRRHFAGRPSVVSRNVGCFLRLLKLQLHVISIVCLHGCKLACEQALHLGEGSEPREKGRASGKTAFYARPLLSLLLSCVSRVCTFYEIL